MHTALVIGLVVAAALLSHAVYAGFSQPTTVPANDVAFDTLDAPTGLGATGGTSASLSWTTTADTYATGHRVLRGTSSGGPYTEIAEVTPRTNTTYVDSPGNGTFYYVARAFFQNWESANSNEAVATVSATTDTGYLDCSANAAVTSGSGDNNGFQLTPGNACSDDTAFARDTNSGTNTNTSCADTGKDRHLYFNYGMSIPAGSTVNGIEVRLDAWIDAGTNASRIMCVELSWDGGVTWASAKTTPTLTTSEATYVVGAATDTWGRAWTTSDLLDANFRLRITNVAPSTARDFSLDWVAVQVTYTPP